MDFTQWLQARGFDPAAITDAQRTALQADWRAAQNPTPAPAPTDGPANSFAQTMDRLRGETAREERITALVAEAAQANRGRLEELERIGQEALAGRWTETQTELALLRAVRPQASGLAGMNGGGRAPLTDRVLEAAIAQTGGLADRESHYDERTLTAADQHKGLGLLQLLDLAARQNGYRGQAVNAHNLGQVARFAFQQSTGPSTISVSGILSNVANKYARDAFNGVDTSILRICARRSVKDFKTITSYSMTGTGEFEEIPAGGKLEHGTLGDVSYTNQAKSYGKLLGLDRRDIINDDLGMFSKVNRKIGRNGATTLNKKGWAKFLNNTGNSFFHADNGNVSTGAGSALSLAGLSAAETAFRLLEDPDGELMQTEPKLLVVPTALRPTAWNLMNSTTTVATTTANTPLPDGNPWAGMFEIVSSPLMQDSSLTGYSAAAWYLLADPEDVPVIEVAFLNGVDQPVVESTEMDFAQLGMLFRGVFDFGFELQEKRGGVRSAGS